MPALAGLPRPCSWLPDQACPERNRRGGDDEERERGAAPPRHHCGVTSIGFGRGPTRRPSGPVTSKRRALSTWRLPLKRQPAIVLGEAHIAGIHAETHADAEADRDQHDVAAAHILGVEAADEISVTLGLGIAAE